MSDSETLLRYLAACAEMGVRIDRDEETSLPPAPLLTVPVESWGTAAAAARAAGLRWSAVWANPEQGQCTLFCLLEGDGDYLALRARAADGYAVPSHARIFAAADRPERHARDLTGVAFEAPDQRRWTRHQAWREGVYPLRGERSDPTADLPPTPPDSDYPFFKAEGAGVVEIPVGPVHAGIIEPGHFRFQAVGETILNLEERLGYVHKGIESLAVGRDPAGLARLAGRVSGDSTVAHSWAACQALERAARADVPERALWLRAVMAERERIANHLGDIGAICNDVGFAFAYYQLTRLKERFVRENGGAFGHRFMMDRVVPGGVACDLGDDGVASMVAEAAALASEVTQIIAMIEDSESLEDRLMATGRLRPDQAEMLGAVGYVGKASGRTFDVRAAAPYPPYDRFEVRIPSYRAGDVAARAKVRAEEIGVSLGLLGDLLESLPGGEVRASWPTVTGECQALGLVEGWRGEIVSYVHLDREGRVRRFFPRDPSWLIWPALELAVQDNIVPDFPVCNKSINGSYSGHDL